MSRITSILFSGLAIFLLSLFFIAPKYQEFQSVNLELKEKRAEFKFIKEYYNGLAEQEEILEQNREAFDKISSAIPEDSFLPSIFHFTSKTAIETGLVIKSIGKFSIASQKDRPDLKEISIEITLNGTYSALKNFLSDLEVTSRIIEVENIKFDLPKDGGLLIDFVLKLKAYSY